MRFSPTIRRYWHKTKQIEALAPKYQAMGDVELKKQTEIFRQALKQGKSLHDILVPVYAVVCEAAYRVVGLRPYREQIFGGVAMEYNNIIEMKTGEGKTLTALMPMYLHGLTGPGNFLITANPYLAQRDAADVGRVYKWLGLSVEAGASDSDDKERDRHVIYGADIVYTTNNALGFDYLFDNLAATKDKQFLRGMRFALLDEVDAVLLDTAQTPLIVAGAPKVQSNLYHSCDKLVKLLVKDEDYEQSDDTKNVWFTPHGIARMEHYFGVEGLMSEQWVELYRHLVIAMHANFLLKRDRDYVVADNKVMLVDRANGRKLEGMQMQGGMH